MSQADPPGFHIYILPKPHLKGINKRTGTFYGKPMVATHSAKIHLMDKYITAITTPLLKRIPVSFKDTGDLLQKLPEKAKSDRTKISTANVI